MTAKTWRDVLKVHPAAELFPLISAWELQALGEDILKNGLSRPRRCWKAAINPGPLFNTGNPSEIEEAKTRQEVVNSLYRSLTGGHRWTTCKPDV